MLLEIEESNPSSKNTFRVFAYPLRRITTETQKHQLNFSQRYKHDYYKILMAILIDS